MAATYDQLNPASVLRDFLLEPLPEIQALGLAYTRIFGTPSLVEGGAGVASGRSIDMSGNPGTLHGSPMVRNSRDILSLPKARPLATSVHTAMSPTISRLHRCLSP